MSDTVFIMKYDFYKDNINKHSKIKVITLINKAYLVEDIITNKRAWVMKCDIYPINNHDKYGEWSYDEEWQKLCM